MWVISESSFKPFQFYVCVFRPTIECLVARMSMSIDLTPCILHEMVLFGFILSHRFNPSFYH